MTQEQDHRPRDSSAQGAAGDGDGQSRDGATLQQDRERWRTYIDEASDLIYTLDATGHITSVNRALCAALGYCAEELLGKGVLDLVAPEGRARAAQALGQVLTGVSVDAIELPVLTRDGQRLILEVRGRMLFEGGRLAGTFSIARDITARVRAEEALRESKERYRLLVENVPVGIFSIDTDGWVLSVNPAMLKIIASPSLTETTAINVLSFPPLVEAGIAADFRRCMETGEPVVSERDYISRWGRRAFVRYVLTPLRDARGRVTGTQALVEDVTEQKQAEERLKASLREKEVLLQEIYHRVKNNLAVVAGLLSLQAQTLQDPQARRALCESEERVAAMARIHAQLYRTRNLGQVDMGDYLQELVGYLGQSYSADAVVLAVSATGVFLALDLAIPCGLIVNELVSNALKYAFPDGWPTGQSGCVHVALERAGADLILTVSDNGAGLPAGLVVEETESLGLKLVRLLAEQLDGVLEMDVRAGTVFRITFRDSAPAAGTGGAA